MYCSKTAQKFKSSIKIEHDIYEFTWTFLRTDWKFYFVKNALTNLTWTWRFPFIPIPWIIFEFPSVNMEQEPDCKYYSIPDKANNDSECTKKTGHHNAYDQCLHNVHWNHDKNWIDKFFIFGGEHSKSEATKGYQVRNWKKYICIGTVDDCADKACFFLRWCLHITDNLE